MLRSRPLSGRPSAHPALRRGAAWLVVVVAAASAACGGNDGDVRIDLDRDGPAPATASGAAPGGAVAGSGDVDGVPTTAASQPALGPGDARIASTDSVIFLALVGDTVQMRFDRRLADSVARAIRQEVDTSDGSIGAAFGAFVASTVGKAVGTALSMVVKVPVTQIDSAHWDDGQLRLTTRGGRSAFSTGGDGKSTAFARADAERFVAALERRRAEIAARTRQ